MLGRAGRRGMNINALSNELGARPEAIEAFLDAIGFHARNRTVYLPRHVVRQVREQFPNPENDDFPLPTQDEAGEPAGDVPPAGETSPDDETGGDSDGNDGNDTPPESKPAETANAPETARSLWTGGPNACPHPHCPAEIPPGEDRCPRCRRSAARCEACGHWNRADARVCRECRAPLNPPPPPPWRMAGGPPQRLRHINLDGGSPLTRETARLELEPCNPPEYPPAEMTLSRDFVIFPDFRERAVRAVTAHGLLPAWTAPLFHPPTLETTGVCGRYYYFAALPGPPARFFRIGLESGALEYLDESPLAPAPGSTPVEYRANHGTYIVWTHAKAFSILHLDEFENPTGLTRAVCHNLREDEELTGSAAMDGTVFATTTHGRVARLGVADPPPVPAMRGARAEEGPGPGYAAGPPIAADGALVYLAAEPNRGHALSFVRWTPGKTERFPLEAGGAPDRLLDPAVLRRLAPLHDGASPFFPAIQTGGLHILRTDGAAFHASGHRFNPIGGLAAGGGRVILTDRDTLYSLPGIHHNPLQPDPPLRLAARANPCLVQTAPAASESGLYVLTDRYVFHFQ